MNNEQGWYAPLKEQTQKTNKKRKSYFLSRYGVLIGVIATLMLITISSLAFSSPNKQSSFQFPSSNRDDRMPSDFDDFFSQFYTVVENEPAEYLIERGALIPDYEFKFSPEGKEELSYQEIYELCSNSIVSIAGYKNDLLGYNWGTGIILSSDGLILTNAHIVEGCDQAEVELFDGRVLEAKLIGADSIGDIAVLKIDASNLPEAQFGDSTGARVGDKVVAIGNPLSETFRATMTDGIISAIDRGINYNGRSMTLLQTDAAINQGNSGGALFNMYGQVIGITNMKMTSTYSSIEGIGFAIPSATVEKLASALIKHGEVRGRVSIGITVGAIPDEALSHYNLPEGLYVSSVEEKSDAAAKGIKKGDIITAANGNPVRETNDILKIRDTLDIGDSISFTIWREGESFTVDVMLMELNDLN